MLPFSLGNWYAYSDEVERWIQHLREAQTQATTEAVRVIRTHLASAASDVALMAANPVLDRFLAHPDDANRQLLQDLFADMMKVRPQQHDQIRLLTTTGRETVRVNRTDREPVALAESLLQDKSDRYYFQDSLALPPGETYLSRLDLNEENGVIESPRKPTIRFVRHVRSGTSGTEGFVVLNYLAQPLLDRLRNLEHLDSTRLLMLNQDGDWIIGREPKEEWGGQLREASGYRLSVRHPELWQRFQTLPSAVAQPMDLDGGLGVVRHVRPEDVLERAGIGALRHPSLQWYLLAETPPEAVALMRQSSLRRYLAYELGFALAFAVLSLILAQMVVRRQQALSDLKERGLELRSLLDSAPDAIIVSDEDGRIVMTNPQADKMFRYPPGEMLGRTIDQLVPQPSSAGHAHFRQSYVRHPVPRAMGMGRDLHAVASDGTLLPVSIALSSYESADGMRIISVARDMTASLELLRSREQAERASRYKSEFLANMSHEIRTPLSVVTGLVYLLERSGLSPEQRLKVSRIQSASKAIVDMLNDVLDMAKIEAGELDLEQGLVDLGELLGQVENLMAPMAEQKGLALSIVAPNPCPFPAVIGDITRLRQVLINLLNNAIKFTEHGSVRLVLSQQVDGTNPQKVMLRFEVVDTGIGIAPEQQTRIFSPFSQEDNTMTRRFGGTGLGLSIVRGIVDRMGGRVGVHSAPGQGATFWVELSCERPVLQASGPAPTLAAHPQTLKVLIAEDDPVQRELLLLSTKGFGWEVEAVDSGEALIETLKDWQGREMTVDCLVVDWDMPGMDGLTAARQIRSTMKADAPPVIVLTGHLSDELHAARDRGDIDALIGKSNQISDLFNAVNQVVAGRRKGWGYLAEVSRVERERIRWLPGVRLLAIDDSELNLEVLSTILGAEGAEVTTCTSGEKAIECVRRLRETGSALPDLIFIDLQMPTLDGYATAEILRREFGQEKVPPMVALTAGALLSERQRATASGMVDYVTKPYDPVHLIRVIRRHVEAYRGAALPTADAPLRPAVGRVPVLAGHLDREMDFAEALGHLRIDVGSLHRMLGKFLRDFGWMREGVHLPETANERQQMLFAMHRLAGNSGLLGATHLQALAGQVEMQLRTSSDIRPLQPLLVQLAVHMERFKSEFDAEFGVVMPPRENASFEGAAAPDALEGDQRDDAIEAWAQSLQNARYDALAQFLALEPTLRATWGADLVEALRPAMNSMDFEAALAILNKARSGG